MKTFAKAIISGFIISIIMSQTTFSAQCEDIPNHLLRLHIIANSDSKEDQDLKLKVRDYILNEASELFINAQDKLEAEHIATTNTDKLINDAQSYVYSLGYDYKVNGKLTNMYFDTRDYDSFSLPAGYYDAFRITIGEGKGHNWWCVMFPPMCFSMAQDGTQLSNVLSPEQTEITDNKEKYEYKFKFVEIYNDIKKNFCKD